MFAAGVERRLLELEEDRDTMILTRARIEPLIEVANVRFERMILWLHLADGRSSARRWCAGSDSSARREDSAEDGGWQAIVAS